MLGEGERVMPTNFANDAKHWRDRAAETRTLAETMNDIGVRALTLKLANDYDKLADRAEDRSNGTSI
jgi:hypothetical protein